MKRTPKITTRGNYDLFTGEKILDADYRVYPKYRFEEIKGKRELLIIVHGMRNTDFGAREKVPITKTKLKHFKWRKPIVAYSYDANVRNAHIKSNAVNAIFVAEKIAKANGTHLASFIKNFKITSHNTKIRLMGHSLGAEVIMSAIENLSEFSNIIYDVTLFGGSLKSDFQTSKKNRDLIERVLCKNFVNYYCPTDEVLNESEKYGFPPLLGCRGAIGKTSKNYVEKKVYVLDHSFYSYIRMMKKF